MNFATIQILIQCIFNLISDNFSIAEFSCFSNNGLPVALFEEFHYHLHKISRGVQNCQMIVKWETLMKADASGIPSEFEMQLSWWICVFFILSLKWRNSWLIRKRQSHMLSPSEFLLQLFKTFRRISLLKVS